MTKMNGKKKEELKLRSVPVRMSDRDLRTLSEKCGRDNISIQDLFEFFVGDLIHGSFYSGSDKSMYADQWYERHGFSCNEDSLLSHLLRDGLVTTVDCFITAWDERAYLRKHPKEIDPEDQWYEDDIRDALEGFNGDPTEDDVMAVREWLEEFWEISGDEDGQSIKRQMETSLRGF